MAASIQVATGRTALLSRLYAAAHGEWFVILGALSGFLCVGLRGSFLGWGTDRDSIRVIGSARAILAGHYVRSRSWGFPLHEALSALLYWAGGVVAVNAGTLIATGAGIVLALWCVGKEAPGRVGLAAVALASAPLLLGCASEALDFGWDFGAAMALLLVAMRLERRTIKVNYALFGVAILALLLLRPDNVLFAAAVTVALTWKEGSRRTMLLAVAACAGLAAAAIYIGLNGVAGLAGGVSTTRSLAERIPRAVALGSAAIGPGGALALLLLARRRDKAGWSVSLLTRTVWLSWVLYWPRFVLLPDQAEYLILPVLNTLLLGSCALHWRPALLCVTLSGLPALVTVSFLARSPAQGTLRFAPALQPGSVVQDWQARRFATEMETPAVASSIATRLHGAIGRVDLRYEIFLPAYVSLHHDLVIGEMHLSRVAALAARTRYHGIWACNAPLGPGIGWRGWEAPLATPPSDFANLHCWESY